MAWDSKGFKKYWKKAKRWGKSYLKDNSAYSVAKTALKGVNAIREIINSEKMYFDTTETAKALSYSGAVVNLSAIAEGDDNGGRTGRSILAKSLHLRYNVFGNTLNSVNAVRIILFFDSMSLGTIPAGSDILQSTGTSACIISPLLLTNAVSGRFKVVYDKVHTFTTTGQMSQQVHKYFKFHRHIKYTGTTATDEGKNQLYLAMFSDVNANDPSITYYARLGYYDN